MKTLSPRHALGEISSTLLIPLAARAFGDAMFPKHALGDALATQTAEQLGMDLQHFLRDPASVFGVLARTALLRQCGRDFFRLHPRATGANLGCGLSHYFQWLDNGRNHWLDADCPEVVALRNRLLPSHSARLTYASVDLRDSRWWEQLGLAKSRRHTPLFLVCEGVLMYLEPEHVHALLRVFGERAPAGSELVFDVTGWMATGWARLHPSVRHTGAQFRWGLRSMGELTAVHPRLRLLAEYPVMEGYGYPYSVLWPMLRAMYGVPLYGMLRMGVVD
jgi:O-methyltransferase involved in polyketide biosynthesis